jgi:hypothetical protein
LEELVEDLELRARQIPVGETWLEDVTQMASWAEWQAACEGVFGEVRKYAFENGFDAAPLKSEYPETLVRKNKRHWPGISPVDLLVLNKKDIRNPITLIERTITIGYKRFKTGGTQDYKCRPLFAAYVGAVAGAVVGAVGGIAALVSNTPPDSSFGVVLLKAIAEVAIPAALLGGLGFWGFGALDGYVMPRNGDTMHYGKEAVARIQR